MRRNQFRNFASVILLIFALSIALSACEQKRERIEHIPLSAGPSEPPSTIGPSVPPPSKTAN